MSPRPCFPTALIVVITLTAMGCRPARSEFDLPRHDLKPEMAGGVATGGIVRFDGRCVWLHAGHDGGVNLVWPRQFRALTGPFEIFGASGVAIIREGDQVDLGVSDRGPRLVAGCPNRVALTVGEVSAVNGVQWPDGTPRTHPRDPFPPVGVPR